MRPVTRWAALILVWAAAVGDSVSCGAEQSRSTPDWSGAWSSEDTPQDGNPGDAASAPLSASHLSDRAMLAPGAGASAQCVDPGMPAIMDHGVPFEFIFSPGRVTLIFQSGVVRRIYTDGRPHPGKDQLYFNPEGHSTGHWDGKTLVVDTVGMELSAEVFRSSATVVSRNTHVVERFSRKNKETLQIDTVLTDPELLTGPYRYRWQYSNVGSMDDYPSGCSAHNRDNGAKVNLTPPPSKLAP